MTGEAKYKSLKILLVTQWFDPEPTFKGLTFAKALQARGHQVSVLTGFPNYPGGKIYPGYSLSLFKRESMDDVDITRVYLYPSHDKSKIGRVLNYISFFFSSLFYLLFMAPRSDVVYAYHPPATTGLSVAIARVFRRSPTLIDIQDMWPDTLSSTGMIRNKTVLRMIGAICRFIYRRVDKIVVLSPGFQKLLMRRGVTQNRIAIIHNWADETASQSDVMPPCMIEADTFKIMFSGNMGEAQDLKTILDAAEILQSSHPLIRIILLGSGTDMENLQHIKTSRKLDNVAFLPRVPMSKVGSYFAAADCLLVHLKPDPLFVITIPSKTQAYLAAGKPIIMGVEGDAANMVLAAGAGIVAQPGNAKSIAAAMINMSTETKIALNDMGKAGQRYYQNELSVAVGVKQFEDHFLKLVKP
jgi:colanic acid biosynthesis glycosyl transferase WcaI